jgi:hypothetical protein
MYAICYCRRTWRSSSRVLAAERTRDDSSYIEQAPIEKSEQLRKKDALEIRIEGHSNTTQERQVDVEPRTISNVQLS